MSINVYLKSDKVKGHEGLTITPRHDGKGEKWEDYSLLGIKLSHDKGRFYIYFSHLTDEIPEILKDLVEEVTYFDYVVFMRERESGIYRYKTAEMEFEYKDYKNNRPHYKIRARSKNMDDIAVLLREIKVGNVRPDESYEVEQGGFSNKELHIKLEDAQRTIVRQEADLLLLEESQNNFKGLFDEQVGINSQLRLQICDLVVQLKDLVNTKIWNIRKKTSSLIEKLVLVEK